MEIGEDLMLGLKQFGATTFLGFSGSLEEFIGLVSQLGLGYLELKCEPGLLYPREVPRAERVGLREALQAHGIMPTVHASFYDINLASLNPLIREASARQLLECLQLAHDLGAEIAVVHPGELPGDYPGELLPRAREGLISSLKEALELAEDLGVTLALENKARGRNRGVIQSAREHLELVEALDSPRCRIAFDVGHAHTFGLGLEEYMKKILPYLVEVHLHDNDGSGDQHRPLGAGTIDFRSLLEALAREGYRGPLILEMGSVKELRQCREYLVQRASLRARG
ncbi:MAG: sugar phosphate isomerase/epimerase family protein [Candidatus Bipolaricaulia bacterium]